MKNKLHLKTGDQVYILSGQDRGKKGKILSVNKKTSRVIVEGVSFVTKHKKPKMNKPGGLMKQEGFVHISNLMIVCNKCNTPTKTFRKILDDGSKVRECKKCNEVIDVLKESK